MNLGVVVMLEHGAEEAFKTVRSFGFPTCQLVCWKEELFTPQIAAHVSRLALHNGVEITTIWAGLPGRAEWNFIEGPTTIGLVPPETRAARVQTLKRASDFAQMVGVNSVTTHVGFIPENPSDANYPGVVDALKEAAAHCAARGQSFWFETGQETPITLLRTIEDVGTGNLGVNLDPANLILYGKANPVDALDILGPYITGVHAKDGRYPVNGRQLGEETPLGQGQVNFPLLLRKLHNLGYTGALTIEREISGDEQISDIRKGKAYLEGILSNLE
jgi:L-ribulose-5-phosphate 3-epimerase